MTSLLLLLALSLPAAPETPVEVVLEALDGSLTRVPAAELRVPAPAALEAVVVRFDGAAPGGGATPAEVTLAGGDRLRGVSLSGEGEQLSVELVGGVRVDLSVEEVDSVLFRERLPAVPDAVIERAPEGDRIWIVTGDVLDRDDGAVEGFGPEGVDFDGLLGRKRYPWSDVAALFVEYDPPAPLSAADGELPVVVDLVEGSRLRGRFLSLDASGLALGRDGGRELFLPLSSLAELSVDDGRVAFLGALPPARTEEGSPFGDDLGLVRGHRVDEAVHGAPLLAGGRRWARGIGVQAPSRIGWDLDGGWRTLRGSVALDDSVQRLAARGSVVFRITSEGELLWESGVVRGGDAPIQLPELDLTGRTELTLEADMSTELHMGDRADWLRMMLVRAEP
jgi:hypothetical protein